MVKVSSEVLDGQCLMICGCPDHVKIPPRTSELKQLGYITGTIATPNHWDKMDKWGKEHRKLSSVSYVTFMPHCIV